MSRPRRASRASWTGGSSSTAAATVEELRRIQPEGPYHLGGVGHGGLIALEVARALVNAGAAVQLVVLVDPMTPESRRGPLQRSALVAHDLLESMLVRRLSTRDLARIARARAGRFVRGERVKLPELTPFQRAAEAARRRYVPEPFSGRLVVLHSVDAPAARWFWASVAGAGLDWQDVPVQAAEQFRRPQVEVLAGRIRELLARARHDS